MDQTAEQNVGETETPQVDSPSTEAPVTEQTAVSDNETVPDTEPKMTDEQRQAFQEMRLELKRLKEEKAARETSESAFQVFKQQPQDIDINQFVDSQGQTNWQAYNQAVAQKARFEASQAARDELDEYKAREKFPDLFANPRTEKVIASQWLYERMQGKNTSVYKIAEEFSKDFTKAVSKAEKAGAEQMLSKVSEKEQAAVTPSKTSTSAKAQLSNDELENLRQQSRGRGTESDVAIAARISKIPYK